MAAAATAAALKRWPTTSHAGMAISLIARRRRAHMRCSSAVSRSWTIAPTHPTTSFLDHNPEGISATMREDSRGDQRHRAGGQSVFAAWQRDALTSAPAALLWTARRNVPGGTLAGEDAFSPPPRAVGIFDEEQESERGPQQISRQCPQRHGLNGPPSPSPMWLSKTSSMSGAWPSARLSFCCTPLYLEWVCQYRWRESVAE